MSGRASRYVDAQGREVPSPKVAGPGHVYIGNVATGRIVYDTAGKRMKVIGQFEGSTHVSVSAAAREFRTGEGKQVRIKGGHDDLSISRGTLVRFTRAVSS